MDLIRLSVEVRGLPGPMLVGVCGCQRTEAETVFTAPGPGRLAIDVLRLLSLRGPGDRDVDAQAAALQIAEFYRQHGAARVLIVREMTARECGGDEAPAHHGQSCSEQACPERGEAGHLWTSVCPLADDEAYAGHPAIEAGHAAWESCVFCGAWRPLCDS